MVRNYRQIIFCNISKQMEDNLYILFQFNLQLVAVPFCQVIISVLANKIHKHCEV